MKRIISLVLACLMLLSAFVIVSSAADDGRYHGDPANGKGLSAEVNAYVLTTAPTFDFDASGNPTNDTLKTAGAIDRSVWGEPTVVAKSSDANTVATNEPNDNVLFAFERAFEEAYKEDPKGTALANSEDGAWKDLSYRLWLAWDNDNFYIAAEIDDPDGYSLKTGSNNVWDGDCLQFMLDPLGPNGVMKYADFDYDYKTTCFDWWTYKAPWYNANNVMNIGVGKVEGLKRNQYQVVNMAPSESGTIISDPKSKRNIKFNIVTADENTVNPKMTVLQLALPWKEVLDTAAYAGNITAENIGVGYILGMSASVLNGSKELYNGSWNSYLNWGSGVTGASMEATAPWFPYVNPGSNAVILSGKTATDTSVDATGAKVAVPIERVKHIDKLLFSDLGDSDNQLPTTEQYAYDAADGIAAALDMAIIAVDPTDASKSLVGWWVGDWFSIYAGYDISTKQFVIAEQAAGEGINREKIYKRSDMTYDWQVSDEEADIPAEWGRLGIKMIGDKIEVYFNGQKVVEDENPRYGHHIISEADAEINPALKVGDVGDPLTGQLLVLNSTAACVYDNYVIASYDYDLKDIDNATATTFLAKFTFDSDDAEWNASPMRSAERSVMRPAYTPLSKDPVFADSATTAFYAEKKAAPAFTPGDANGDGKVNSKDVVAVMKAIVGVEVKGYNKDAADFDGNGKINSKDVVAIMKAIVAK